MDDLLLLVIYAICATVIAPLTGVLVLPFVLLFRTLFIWPVMRKSLLRKAVQKGNIVTAKYVKRAGYMLRDEGGTHHGGSYTAKYEYEYQGRKFTKQLTSQFSTLPEEVELYFVKKPKRASVAKTIGIYEPNMLLCYLISVGIVWVSVVMFGMFYVSGNIL